MEEVDFCQPWHYGYLGSDNSLLLGGCWSGALGASRLQTSSNVPQGELIMDLGWWWWQCPCPFTNTFSPSLKQAPFMWRGLVPLSTDKEILPHAHQTVTKDLFRWNFLPILTCAPQSVLPFANPPASQRSLGSVVAVAAAVSWIHNDLGHPCLPSHWFTYGNLSVCSILRCSLRNSWISLLFIKMQASPRWKH